MPEQITPGVVATIIPPPGRPGSATGEAVIVIRRDRKPSPSWVAEQLDERMRQYEEADWWSVMPLSGGLLLVPETLLRHLRPASYEDIMKAVDHANNDGRRTLATLFPDVIAQLLSGARPGQ